MNTFYGFRLRSKPRMSALRPHVVLPPPLNADARERLRWRIVDLAKSPVDMSVDELRAWIETIPQDELNELLALSHWSESSNEPLTASLAVGLSEVGSLAPPKSVNASDGTLLR